MTRWSVHLRIGIVFSGLLVSCSMIPVKHSKGYKSKAFEGKSFSFFPVSNQQIISVSNMADSLNSVLSKSLGQHVRYVAFKAPPNVLSPVESIDFKNEFFRANKKTGFSMNIPTKEYLEKNGMAVDYLLILDSLFLSINFTVPYVVDTYGLPKEIEGDKVWFYFAIWDYRQGRAVSYGKRTIYMGSSQHALSRYGRWETIFRQMSSVVLKGTRIAKDDSRKESYWYLK